MQLVKKEWMPLSLEEMEQYATIIGPDVNQLWDIDTQKPTDLYYQIRKTKMLIYAWTFRDDYQTMLLF